MRLYLNSQQSHSLYRVDIQATPAALPALLAPLFVERRHWYTFFHARNKLTPHLYTHRCRALWLLYQAPLPAPPAPLAPFLSLTTPSAYRVLLARNTMPHYHQPFAPTALQVSAAQLAAIAASPAPSITPSPPPLPATPVPLANSAMAAPLAPLAATACA